MPIQRSWRCLALAVSIVVSMGAWGWAAERDDQPVNVILIMTDNHGAWTLGCYGNEDIRTPHIDRLASEGMRFTRAYSVNAVCSPTRASCLTGLLPSQHGVHCFLRANEAQMGPDAYSTIGEFATLPSVLADHGYTCGLVGKWHLGENTRPQQGFSYWITMPHGATSRFYGAQVIEDGKVRVEQGYLTDLWTRHAVRFVEQNREKPFFLFLSYNGPYGLGGSLRLPARNRHVPYYADKLLLSFPRRLIHPWLFNNRDFMNNIDAIRRYAAELSGVDDGVGEMLDTLRRLGLDKKTLVVFTADQGWGGGQHGIWGMGDHTRPLHAFDWTTHIPLIVRLPSVVPPGEESSLMVSTVDVPITMLSLAGHSPQPLLDQGSPGRDFSAALRGQDIEWDNEVYYEFENVRAVRTEKWKYIERVPDGPNELYDLENDPGEEFNEYGQSYRQTVQRMLRDKLHAHFARHADPQFDLWRGGRSKPRLLVTGTNRLMSQEK